MTTPTLRLESAPCPACGVTDSREAFLARAYASNRSHLRFPYRWCAGCGALYASPRVPEAEIGAFYGAAYHPNHSDVARRWKGLLQLATVLDMGLRAPEGVLDWGCGGGEFVWLLRALGKTAVGFDAYASADVDGLIRDEARALDALVDLRTVTMLDSLEHVYEPVDLFRRLRRHADLEVYVFVPRADSDEIRVFGSRAYVVQAPNHVFLPTERSLQAIAERAGWTVSFVPVTPTDFWTESWQLRFGRRAFAAQGSPGLPEKIVARVARLHARFRRDPARRGAHLGAIFRPAAGA